MCARRLFGEIVGTPEQMKAYFLNDVDTIAWKNAIKDDFQPATRRHGRRSNRHTCA
jgi:hypothetical protein